MCQRWSLFFLFFFNDTATTEIYTLSLHDALPIWASSATCVTAIIFFVQTTAGFWEPGTGGRMRRWAAARLRSEEHTSELQSRLHLVCRLLLEKKKKATIHRANLTTSQCKQTRSVT